ncbi:acyl-coenzyme A thioesterase 11 isoform X3 [Ascaphus truei]|uniref:acyl-coenzyme A thioesterase 11 isoform X3 n=1 Tax=Ascaphus truei TaxID=8439 RepID=UPI003F599A85
MADCSEGPRNPTEVRMSQMVLPYHANHCGQLSSGQLLKWIDTAACLSAERHAGCSCVTASMDDIYFEHTISVGQVVNLKAKVNRAFNSSMEVGIQVTSEDLYTGNEWKVCHAYATFVAQAQGSGKVKLSPLTPLTEDEELEHSIAAERRRMRLVHTDTIKELLTKSTVQDERRHEDGENGEVLAEKTRVESVELVLPPHANHQGNTFGGQIMAWMENVATIAASSAASSSDAAPSGGLEVSESANDAERERSTRSGDVASCGNASPARDISRGGLHEAAAHGNGERLGRRRAQPKQMMAPSVQERRDVGTTQSALMKWPPSKKRATDAWIIGDSHVHWAEKRAIKYPYGRNLGLGMKQAKIFWWGRRGLLWGELLSRVLALAKVRRPPLILFIHAGGNDLAVVHSIKLINAIKKDLAHILALWPGIQIIWSDIICRKVWKGASVDRARIKVNTMVGTFVTQCGGWVICHPEFNHKTVDFFQSDGEHLSDVGIDLFNNQLQEEVQRVLAKLAVKA